GFRPELFELLLSEELGLFVLVFWPPALRQGLVAERHAHQRMVVVQRRDPLVAEDADLPGRPAVHELGDLNAELLVHAAEALRRTLEIYALAHCGGESQKATLPRHFTMQPPLAQHYHMLSRRVTALKQCRRQGILRARCWTTFRIC